MQRRQCRNSVSYTFIIRDQFLRLFAASFLVLGDTNTALTLMASHHEARGVVEWGLSGVNHVLGPRDLLRANKFSFSIPGTEVWEVAVHVLCVCRAGAADYQAEDNECCPGRQ